MRLRSRTWLASALAPWLGCSVEPGQGLVPSGASPGATGWTETADGSDDDSTTVDGDTSMDSPGTSTGDPTSGAEVGTESSSSFGSDDGVVDDSTDTSAGEIDPAPPTVDAVCSGGDSPHAAEPPGGTAELHVFATYAGSDGEITISLGRTDVPLVLSLSAYDPTTWWIEREPGVELEGVVVSGYGAQQVQGLEGAVLIDAAGPLASLECTPSQWPDADCDAAAFAQWAELQTGGSLTTFTGCYEATSFALH